MLGMEPQGLMSYLTDRVTQIAKFVCKDTKLVDVVIFFPLVSNVL